MEIERLTKELGDALSSDDRESVQLLFGMRKEEMDKAGEGRERIITILEALEETDQAELRAILNEEDVQKAEDFESRKIIELNGQIKNVLNRTISIDKVISRKLAGEHSYYQ